MSGKGADLLEDHHPQIGPITIHCATARAQCKYGIIKAGTAVAFYILL